jgi:hypothetical protein
MRSLVGVKLNPFVGSCAYTTIFWNYMSIVHPNQCLEREYHYLQLLKPEYNICPRAAHKGLKAGNKNAMFKKIWKRESFFVFFLFLFFFLKTRTYSDEALVKISAFRKGIKDSEETKLKMMGNSKGKNKPNAKNFSPRSSN